MTRKFRGELLTTEELKEIAENFVLTKHAEQRITERFAELNIEKAILNPLIAYFNTDGSINIALNTFEYLVIGTDQTPYRVITFKEKSHNNIDIFTKRKMAMQGKSRKLHWFVKYAQNNIIKFFNICAKLVLKMQKLYGTI